MWRSSLDDESGAARDRQAAGRAVAGGSGRKWAGEDVRTAIRTMQAVVVAVTVATTTAVTA
ncbi:hypothetical protein ABZY45_06850 [Streptomyces sp. NPDC006516]|uniref:hypothetical protein n=1 Tax=Streptomyces sp. NPDC006516 TaxID=3154309 RepID=UPI0033A275AA